MDLYGLVETKLNALKIPFEVVDHPPALTTEEADSFIEGIEGVRTKSMFLTNKKKTAYYLLIIDDQKRLDMSKLKEITGEKRIKMASEDSLMEKMKLPAGVVSIFGLLNNEEKDIHVYFDKEITKKPRMSFHPNVNTKTIFLYTNDIFKYLENIGFNYSIIDI
ncbi:prolyl-tRNA synthetase associated domain-containing protein [Enterococcus canintestini]|uniref:Prolyl-tRNA synthetase n=1 Tax=Enterococcus canintestini TaxID=317010 RepID=A0A267HU32_9ENTE|nr:prolyl-tRNA synthetase associated domain-containing protein [Enterococcus canintestini]PAB01727.1 prolyl-tRNA synthetase [Enterococcus canintestini]